VIASHGCGRSLLALAGLDLDALAAMGALEARRHFALGVEAEAGLALPCRPCRKWIANFCLGPSVDC
jgi:hypothetical protein